MIRIIISLVISAAALWWAFRDLDWQAFGAALAQANLSWIIVAVLVMLLPYPLRGIRWRIFIAPVKKDISVRLTTEATLVGYFGNNALPFRLGELLRAYFIARQVKVPLAQMFGTVIVERTVDVLSAIVLLAFLPLVGTPEWLTQPVIWAIALGLVVGLITIWLVRQKRDVPFVRGWLKHLVDDLQLSFASLREERKQFPVLFLTTIVIWLIYLLNIHIAQHAMGLGLSIAESYLILVVTTLVLWIPAAPGFIGTFHAAVITVCVYLLSITEPQAQAMAVVLHAIGYIPQTIIGAIFFFKSHIRLRDVQVQSLITEP